MASKPSLLLFDDPTVGLDPVIATNIDDEIVKLRDLGRATSIAVTHQIRDAFYWATHEAGGTFAQPQILPATDAKAAQVGFMVLHEGRIFFEGSSEELMASHDAYLREFLFMTLPPW
jgi:phospholipid/cholesterol/gamma-HCH transport system ATP-binding protein